MKASGCAVCRLLILSMQFIDGETVGIGITALHSSLYTSAMLSCLEEIHLNLGESMSYANHFQYR